MMNEKEIWKDIPGYEGVYQASNLGRIKSLSHTRVVKQGKYKNLTRSYKERILKPIKQKKGYNHINLWKNQKRCHFRLSRIILKTFDPHIDQDILLCDHINGNRGDDRLENLRWATRSENVANHKYARYLQDLLEKNKIEFKSPQEFYDDE